MKLISLLVFFLFVSFPIFLLLPSLLRDLYPNYAGWGQAVNVQGIPYIKYTYFRDVLQYIFPINTQGFHRVAQSAYIGTIGFFFVLISLFFSKDKIRYLFLGLFLLVWCTSLGKSSLLYLFLSNFGIYNKIRWINYLFNFAAIPLVVLIGYGIKSWVSKLIGNHEEPNKKMMKYSLIISFSIVILALMAYLKIVVYGGHSTSIYHGRLYVEPWKFILFQAIVPLLIMMVFVYFIYKNKINISKETKQKLLLLVTGIFISFQLIMYYFYTSNYYFNIGYWRQYARPPLRKEDAPLPRQTSFEPFTSYLSKDYIVDDTKGYLIVNTKRLSEHNYGFLTNKLLIPYYFGLVGIPDTEIKNRILHKPIIGLVEGKADINRYYAKIINKDYTELESVLEQLDLDGKHESTLRFPFSNFRRQKNKAKFGISVYELPNSGIPYCYSTNPYSDTHHYLSALSDNKPMQETWYNEFHNANAYQLGYEKPRKIEISVQEDNKPQNVSIHFWDLLKDVNIEEFRGDYLRLSVNVKSKNFLFYEMFNDGKWKAYIDQSPVKIEVLTGGFMGINLPQGMHTVQLYHDFDFIKRYLMLLSVVTYFLIIVIYKLAEDT